MEEITAKNSSTTPVAAVKHKDKSFPLFHGLNVIGRKREAQVPIVDASISHNHAFIIVLDENKMYLCDFHSTNGTVLNGNMLKPLHLYQINFDTNILLAHSVDISVTKHITDSVVREHSHINSFNSNMVQTFSQNSILEMDTQLLPISSSPKVSPSTEKKSTEYEIEINCNKPLLQNMPIQNNSSALLNDKQTTTSYHEMPTQILCGNVVREITVQDDITLNQSKADFDNTQFREMETQIIDTNVTLNEPEDQIEKTKSTTLNIQSEEVPSTSKTSSTLSMKPILKSYSTDPSTDSLDDFDESELIAAHNNSMTINQDVISETVIEDSFDGHLTDSPCSSESINLLEDPINTSMESQIQTKTMKRCKNRMIESDSDSESSPVLLKKATKNASRKIPSTQESLCEEATNAKMKIDDADSSSSETDIEDQVTKLENVHANTSDIIPATQDAFADDLEFNFVTQDLVNAANKAQQLMKTAAQQRMPPLQSQNSDNSLHLCLTESFDAENSKTAKDIGRDDQSGSDTDMDEDTIKEMIKSAEKYDSPNDLRNDRSATATEKDVRTAEAQEKQRSEKELFVCPIEKTTDLNKTQDKFDFNKADEVLEVVDPNVSEESIFNMATQKITQSTELILKVPSADDFFNCPTQKIPSCQQLDDEKKRGAESVPANENLNDQEQDANIFSCPTQRIYDTEEELVRHDEIATEDIFNCATQKISNCRTDDEKKQGQKSALADENVEEQEKDKAVFKRPTQKTHKADKELQRHGRGGENRGVRDFALMLEDEEHATEDIFNCPTQKISNGETDCEKKRGAEQNRNAENSAVQDFTLALEDEEIATEDIFNCPTQKITHFNDALQKQHDAQEDIYNCETQKIETTCVTHEIAENENRAFVVARAASEERENANLEMTKNSASVLIPGKNLGNTKNVTENHEGEEEVATQKLEDTIMLKALKVEPTTELPFETPNVSFAENDDAEEDQRLNESFFDRATQLIETTDTVANADKNSEQSNSTKANDNVSAKSAEKPIDVDSENVEEENVFEAETQEIEDVRFVVAKQEPATQVSFETEPKPTSESAEVIEKTPIVPKPPATVVHKDDIESQLEVLFSTQNNAVDLRAFERPGNPVADIFSLLNTQTETQNVDVYATCSAKSTVPTADADDSTNAKTDKYGSSGNKVEAGSISPTVSPVEKRHAMEKRKSKKDTESAVSVKSKGKKPSKATLANKNDDSTNKDLQVPTETRTIGPEVDRIEVRSIEGGDSEDGRCSPVISPRERQTRSRVKKPEKHAKTKSENEAATVPPPKRKREQKLTNAKVDKVSVGSLLQKDIEAAEEQNNADIETVSNKTSAINSKENVDESHMSAERVVDKVTGDATDDTKQTKTKGSLKIDDANVTLGPQRGLRSKNLNAETSKISSSDENVPIASVSNSWGSAINVQCSEVVSVESCTSAESEQEHSTISPLKQSANEKTTRKGKVAKNSTVVSSTPIISKAASTSRNLRKKIIKPPEDCTVEKPEIPEDASISSIETSEKELEGTTEQRTRNTSSLEKCDEEFASSSPISTKRVRRPTAILTENLIAAAIAQTRKTRKRNLSNSSNSQDQANPLTAEPQEKISKKKTSAPVANATDATVKKRSTRAKPSTVGASAKPNAANSDDEFEGDPHANATQAKSKNVLPIRKRKIVTETDEQNVPGTSKSSDDAEASNSDDDFKPSSSERRSAATTKLRKTKSRPSVASTGGTSEESSVMSLSMCSPRTKRALKPKVVFTMYESPSDESIIRRLGGQMVDSVDACTVLVTQHVKRTHKLLSAIGQGKPIVSPAWVDRCRAANKFLDPWEHIILDEEAETKWNFSMRGSLEIASHAKLYENHVFQLAVSNAADVLKGAIESCGGKCVTRAPAKNSFAVYLVISSPEEKGKYSRILKQKNAPLVVASEAIFLGVLQQKILWDEFRLKL